MIMVESIVTNEDGSVADISTPDEVTNVSGTIANHNFSGWVSVKDRLPEILETVWVSNVKGLTTPGCRIYLYSDGKRLVLVLGCK
jgi:hypothetical protein